MEHENICDFFGSHFSVLLVLHGYSLGTSEFLPQPINIPVKLIGESKFAVGVSLNASLSLGTGPVIDSHLSPGVSWDGLQPPP